MLGRWWRHLWSIFVAKERRDKFFRSADVTIHRVNAAHTSQPLLVLLLAFREMGAGRQHINWTNDRNPFVVFRRNQQLTFRTGRREHAAELETPLTIRPSAANHVPMSEIRPPGKLIFVRISRLQLYSESTSAWVYR